MRNRHRHASAILRQMASITFGAACICWSLALPAGAAETRTFPTRAWVELACGGQFPRTQFDQAITACDEAIAADPGNPTLLLARAYFRQQQHSYDLALHDLDEAVRLAPGIPLVYGRRSVVYEQKGDLDNAIKDKSREIALIGAAAGDAEYRVERAELYRRHGDFDLGIADYSRAIELNPGPMYTYYRRGYLFEKKGDFAKALADYDHAAGDRCYSPPYLGRARIYASQHDFKSAIADYSRAIKISPADARAYRGRAEALKQTGDLAGAEADLAHAEGLSPGIAEAEKLDASGAVNLGKVKLSPSGTPMPPAGAMACLKADE